MNEFKYKSKYGEYDRCVFQAGRYENGNIALEVWSQTEGPITRITVNPDRKIPDDCLAIKDYSENEGVVDWMKSMGLIEDTPNRILTSGFVEIPVYEMTSKMKSILLGELI